MQTHSSACSADVLSLAVDVLTIVASQLVAVLMIAANHLAVVQTTAAILAAARQSVKVAWPSCVLVALLRSAANQLAVVQKLPAVVQTTAVSQLAVVQMIAASHLAVVKMTAAILAAAKSNDVVAWPSCVLVALLRSAANQLVVVQKLPVVVQTTAVSQLAVVQASRRG